ncbi:hypothetical protein C8Q75DRAFT_728744 [Abortiporus biennis]|nr:hypothetical protein C8Q75DRAFT_728744 [Abortiporus biennis]
MQYEFLLPYSPDFNLIELAFSAIKAHLYCTSDITQWAMSLQYNNVEVLTHLNEAVFSVTSVDAYGWFHHCGYV